MKFLSKHVKRQLLLLIALLSSGTLLKAQGINDSGFTLRQMLDSIRIQPEVENDSSEGGRLSSYKMASTFWSARVTENTSNTTNMFKKYYQTLNEAVNARMTSNCSGGGQFQGAWECLGPDKLDKQGMGYVECIWVNPYDANIILAGTYGGLFKTEDGGAHWRCITDNAPITNGIFIVTSIAVQPGNEDVIYLGTGSIWHENIRLVGNGGVWGASIIKTTNGGQTWEQEVVGTVATPGDVMDRIQKIYFTPSGNKIIAFKNNQIFIRSTNGSTWTEITAVTNPLSIYGDKAQWRDLEFVPGDANADSHFFIGSANLIEAVAGGVYEVQYLGGGGWDISSIISLGSNSMNIDPCLRAEISIPDGNNLFALFVNDWVGPRTIARYDLNTQDWYLIKKDPDVFFYGDGIFDPNQLKAEFVVSPYQVGDGSGGALNYNMYVGGLNVWQSYDGGQTFIDLGNYWGPNTHGDIRHLILYEASNIIRGDGDVVYIATDGGVAKKDGKDAIIHHHFAFEDISGEGLTCTTFWGVATSEAGGAITAGAQHDGMFAYEPDKNPKWFLQDYGDGASTVFDEVNKKQSWGTGWTNGTYYNTSSANGRDIGIWNVLTTNPTDPPAFPKDPKVANFIAPMCVDKSNNQYTGQQSLWQKPNGNTTWVSLSNSTLFPLNYLNLPLFTESYIRAMAFSPYPSLPVGYVIYDKVDNEPNSLKIWRRIPGIGMYPDFEPINSPSSHKVVDVTLDPANPSRVWISIGDIISSNGVITKDRVYYSPNAGDTWYDVSKGLPESMPVTALICQEGTNNIYCATDIGMYKCDFTNFNSGASLTNGVNTSVEWICFNKPKIPTDPEFPKVFVTKLAINYCEGKLIAATYGRGIWSTSLYAFDEFPVSQPLIINIDDTWSSNRYITNDIKVASGHILKINNATIHMPRNGHIIVEPGAKLEVNNSTITNDCAGCMWYGIQAMGNPNLPQTAANQALVVIKNSVLEHARSAVMNWGKSVNTTGGIIKVTDTKFINNRRSVEFESYHNINGSSWRPNLSYFTNCLFKIDDNYRGSALGYPFKCMASLWDVEGVRFTGCKFYNWNHGVQNGLGNGIESYNAGYSVLPYCSFPTPTACGSPILSTFRGFRDGIYVGGDLALAQTVAIDQAEFDSVAIGVHNNAMNNVSVTRCNFTVGNGSDAPVNTGLYVQECHDNIGIYNKNVAQFRIEENTFTGTSGRSRQTFGTIVENGDANNNIVYRNTFYYLNYGIVSMGVNGENRFYYHPREGYFATGLDFQCNNSVINTGDVSLYIDGGGDYSKGARKVLGSRDRYARNAFGGGPPIDMGGHIVNMGYYNFYYNNYEYQYPQGSISRSYFKPIINGAPNTQQLITNNDNDCISTISSGWSPVGISNTSLATLKTDWYTNDDFQKLVSNAFEGLIDGGNTPALIDAIVNCENLSSPYYSSDYSVIHSYISSFSPFVSKDAMVAAFSTLPMDNRMYELLYNNNDLILEDEINELAKFYFLGDNGDLYQSLLYEVMYNGGTSRMSIQSLINECMYNKTNDVNQILMALKTPRGEEQYTLDSNSVYYGNDSTATFGDADSINVWLQRSGTLWAQYELLGHFNYPEIFPSFWGSAQELIDSIGRTIPIDDSDKIMDYQGYQDVFAFLSNLKEQNKTIFDFTAADLDSPILRPGIPLMDNDPYQYMSVLKSPIIADAIYQVNIPNTPGTPERIPTPYIPCMTKAQGSNARRARPEDPQSKQPKPIPPITKVNTIYDDLHVYPNPAKYDVTFNYSISSQSNNHVLVITNALGAVVKEFKITERIGTLKWDVHDMVPGVYLYKLNAGSKNYTGKIVVAQ